MGDMVLRVGKKNVGIKPGFVLSISSDNKLFAWDENGHPVHFIDFERGDKPITALPLERYCGGFGGIPFLNLLVATAGFGLEFTIFSDTKLRCRCEIPGDLYRVTDPNRPIPHIITLGKGAKLPYARPVT